MADTVDLLSASEAEEEFGTKLFYRQRIYRLAASKRIKEFNYRGSKCYPGYQILENVIDDLELKLKSQISELRDADICVIYDPITKSVAIDGLAGHGINCNANDCSEEEILLAARAVMNENANSADKILSVDNTGLSSPPLLSKALPTDIEWVQLSVSEVEGVDVRSLLLLNLSTVADFVGVRSQNLSRWIRGSSFKDNILSISHKQIQGAPNGAPWKRGVVSGLTAYLPFELLPELLVAFRNSEFKVTFPAKAQMLYEISSEALKAVGLAMSGNKDKAALALAEVGKGLGLDVADQIIGIMKTYSSRDFQVQTHREFSSTVKKQGGDYALVTGKLTFGITGRNAREWLRIGKQEGLKTKDRSSAREVMRNMSPADSVGMAFGEKNYSVRPDEVEAIETGVQGKNFYERLKNVGLLEG